MEIKAQPKNLQYFIPVLDIIRKLGGSANVSEIKDELIAKFNMSDEQLAEKFKSGVLKIDNRIAWARVYLHEAGLINISSDKIWTLTEKGLTENPSGEEILRFFHEIHSRWALNNKKKKVEIIDEENEIIENQSYKENFLNLLKTVKAEGFERFCQRLLRELGFKKVVVKGRSGDGGIDGEGLLEINPLISLKVIFQSKRYKDSVAPSYIRDFRGAMQGRAEKGIFISTGRFTAEAKAEATREGVIPIELIDGDRLVELCSQHNLGLKPVTTYEVDESFFNEYKD